MIKNMIDKGQSIETLGTLLIRLGVALVLIWIGAMKFTAYEAGAIEGLVASSPFTGWMYSVFSLQMTANIIGSIEIFTGILVLSGLRFPLLGAFGAFLAAGTFAMTSTFLLSAPGWEASLGGFPALSVVPGQFLLKDLVLFGAAVYLMGHTLQHCKK